MVEAGWARCQAGGAFWAYDPRVKGEIRNSGGILEAKLEFLRMYMPLEAYDSFEYEQGW